jgi:hypothetical protein
MAFIENVTPIPRTGATGFSFGRPGTLFPTLEEVLGVPTGYRPGSQITIRETITISCTIVDEHKIDRDHRWFFPKDYIGTYQLIGFFGERAVDMENFGFLNSVLSKIVRERQYTVIDAPEITYWADSQLRIDQCNLVLGPGIYPPGLPPIPATAISPVVRTDILKGGIYRLPTPLKNPYYIPQIGGIGLFINDGARVDEIQFKLEEVATVQTNYPQGSPPTCVLADLSCDSQFSAFLISRRAFASLGACNADPGSPCGSGGTYTCPSDSSYTRPFYVHLDN